MGDSKRDRVATQDMGFGACVLRFKHFTKPNRNIKVFPVWIKRRPSTPLTRPIHIPLGGFTNGIAFFADAGQGGDDQMIMIDSIEVSGAVPLPGALLFLGSGLLFLVRIRRKLGD